MQPRQEYQNVQSPVIGYCFAHDAPSSVKTRLPLSRRVVRHPVNPEAELRLLRPRKAVLHRQDRQRRHIPSDTAREIPLRHILFRCLGFVEPMSRALTRHVVGREWSPASQKSQLLCHRKIGDSHYLWMRHSVAEFVHICSKCGETSLDSL